MNIKVPRSVPMVKSIRDFSSFFSHLKSIGFTPKTLIDVGAASGTHGFYHTFPDAFYVLIDALEEYKEAMDRILARKKHGVSYVCAIGQRDGNVDLHVSKALDESTFYHQATISKNVRNLKLRKLDTLLDVSSLDGPIILKTDIQGADLDAILGAPDLLTKCEVIIMEVAMFGSGGGEGPDFTTVVLTMDRLGWVAYDFLGYLTRTADGALGQVDVAFVRKDGVFRQYKLWG